MFTRRHQGGQAIVIIALMLTVLIGMVAIAIDGSRAYALRRELQAAVDSAALAAGDKLQQSGSWVSAEQAASAIFASNLRLYNTPSCSGYGSPGIVAWTVTCTYSDGTVLTEVAEGLGPQGSQFTVSAQSNLQLQFARMLTNGLNPTLAATSTGNVNHHRYTPAIAALDQAGCGGAGGTAISVSGSGTMSVMGDVVSNGTVSNSGTTMRVAGDVYARCQSSVPGVVTACYPSGATTPCTYPDVAGATRSGFHLADPNFPPPSVTGGSQGLPGNNAVLFPGAYAANPNFTSGRCWFLSAGVYEWLGGYTNSADFVSNELKPPDEAVAGGNTVLSSHQFWNTGGFSCAGSFRVSTVNDNRTPVRNGTWGVELTSGRIAQPGGTFYVRESAPSMCRTVNTATKNDIVVEVSNVPGAEAYGIYLSPPGGACNGPFGLAGVLTVSGTVSNNTTTTCPVYSGPGCSLGNEQVTISQAFLGAGWAPNPLAAPDTVGAPPPDAETTPLQTSLSNQNPGRGAGPGGGDRANENQCDTIGGAYATCPAAITPGAVEFYVPSGGCMSLTGTGDNFVFSGYQYDWVVLYEPGPGNGPANTCSNVLGAAGNSAFTGFLYAPSAAVSMPSSWLFESGGMGGLLADTVTITGSPALSFDPDYAPVPPAGRLTG